MPKKSPCQTLIESINQCLLFEALDKDDKSSSDSDLETGSESDESSTEELPDLMHMVHSSRTIEDHQSIPKTAAMQNHIFEMADKEFQVHAQMTQDSFQSLLSKIEKHPVFSSNSPRKQMTVKVQLLVALEQFGCSGNGAGVARTSHYAGVSWGSIVLYTQR
ncbi:hypothetical protein HDU80_002865, partial [Chytriomyces hyalinus]